MTTALCIAVVAQRSIDIPMAHEDGVNVRGDVMLIQGMGFTASMRSRIEPRSPSASDCVAGPGWTCLAALTCG